MKYCPTCGTSMEDAAQFCPQCGGGVGMPAAPAAPVMAAPAPMAPVVAPVPPKKSKKALWILLSVALAAVVLVTALVYPGWAVDKDWEGPHGTYTGTMYGLNVGTLTFESSDCVIDESFGEYKEATWTYESGIVHISYPSGTSDSYLYDAVTDTLTHTAIDFCVYTKN